MGLIVMTFMLASMVASKVMLAPMALVNFSVIRLSMLLSVNAVLSMLRTASLKVIVMLLLMGTTVAPSAGLNDTVGAVVSVTVVATVTLLLEALERLPAASIA